VTVSPVRGPDNRPAGSFSILTRHNLALVLLCACAEAAAARRDHAPVAPALAPGVWEAQAQARAARKVVVTR